ncbi:MSCRAMM family protein [Candidatus Methanocrinis natronophilus]|uniref:SD-repeat containing protein B domain-containing protein n=1 Tax=Candidatus Methanocrinis natronophilus TaxID=3033396 RepID=A0ABT5XAC4_9EURY|nr:hypothetical protein [Candidatus Methanocrinis natronophilus]MDF0591641.1 hypothetical protein [Candidatus Methanocrinis natronophilus]
MKGSSSSAYAFWLAAAVLTSLIFLAGASANDHVISEKAVETSPSEDSPWNRYIYSKDAGHIFENKTDENGRWEICGLPPGTYKVCEVVQEGWVQTYPINESSGDPVCHIVEITNSSISDIDFLNRGDYCLSGHKYWDKNKNRQRDPGEEFLSGWIIIVEGETNRWRTTTNNNGYWKICNLPSGTYSLSESAPGGARGWIASEKPGKVTITNQSIRGLNFGNYFILHDEPRQYEQFCESQLVEGTGYMDVGTSLTDRKLAIDYNRVMYGEGYIGLESAQVYSQEPNKLIRPLPNASDPSGATSHKLNFFENTKLEFDGTSPLVGSRSITSRDFYGGIGANIQETFNVKRLEADNTVFLGHTSNSTIRHTVGLNTQSSFNGTLWTESSFHKIFYKDIRRRDVFSGEFEVQRELKFHENPSEFRSMIGPCRGVDC